MLYLIICICLLVIILGVVMLLYVDKQMDFYLSNLDSLDMYD